MKIKVHGDWLTAMIRHGGDSTRETIRESLNLTIEQIQNIQEGWMCITGDSETGLTLDMDYD